MTKCKEMVLRTQWWRPEQCRNKAVTPAGYCRVHDPEMRKEREAKRPPTAFERRSAARYELNKLLATLPKEMADQIKGLVERSR